MREVVVVRAECVAEGFEGFAGQADGEEEEGSGKEREELLRSRGLASGCGQRAGGGGWQGIGEKGWLPADVVDDAQAD